ncbi:MAG: hypothetical protein PHQ27_04005 [Victivallales bacterium]|nr:hypothetical protein [Victivallales bacterium]
MTPTHPIRIDLSNIMFRQDGAAERLAGIRAACDRYGFESGMQLHNTSTAEDIAAAVATGLPLTAHIPLLGDYQINLGTTQMAPTWESMAQSVAVMRRYGITQAVVHGLVMTDLPIPAFGRGRSYDQAMQAILRPEISLPGSRLCGDFFALPEFAARCELVRNHLAEAKRLYPDIELLLENDFPCYGAGNLFADCAAQLGCGLCLDSSHLWASSFIFDRDFMTEAAAFLATGRVRMVHLHASKYTAATPKTAWGDGHLPLTTPNAMGLPELVSRCRKADVRHFVLEIARSSAADIDCLAAMWAGEGGTYEP